MTTTNTTDTTTRRAQFVAAAAGALRELAEHYVALHGAIGPGGVAPSGGGGGGGHRPPGPRVPLNVDVVDTIRAVENYVLETGPVVWGALRRGMFPSPFRGDRMGGVVSALRTFADALADVDADDPDVASTTGRAAFRLRYRAAVLLGHVVPPRPLTGAGCPGCGGVVWVRPETGELRCQFVDECGWSDDAVALHARADRDG